MTRRSIKPVKQSRFYGLRLTQVTPRDLTREMDRMRKQTRRVEADPTVSQYGARKFRQLESKVKEAGGWSKLLRGTEPEDQILKRSLFQDIKDIGGMQSVSIKSARKQADFGNRMFGSNFARLSDNEKTAVWNAMHDFVNHEANAHQLGSERIIAYMAELMRDPTFTFEFERTGFYDEFGKPELKAKFTNLEKSQVLDVDDTEQLKQDKFEDMERALEGMRLDPERI